MVLTLDKVRDILYHGDKIDLSELPIKEIGACFSFLKEFSADKVIYGINTGFGPMAQWRVDDKYLSEDRKSVV